VIVSSVRDELVACEYLGSGIINEALKHRASSILARERVFLAWQPGPVLPLSFSFGRGHAMTTDILARDRRAIGALDQIRGNR
tara:strand:- start:639 stop:887 length:249 start_codon:yes stop_codon:yes gene_type:complete